MKPTMTLHECANAMRDAGIACSPRGIADSIQQGVYTFGRMKSISEAGNRRFEIWRVDFDRWLSERTGGC